MAKRLVVLSAVLQALVVAQEPANCTDSTWNWSFNSEHQDPCLVAQALRDLCLPHVLITQLGPGQYYAGGPPSETSECSCNMVYYSLLSACGQCQFGSASAWQFWSQPCVATTPEFPKPFPGNISVPDWAFLPLLANGTVDFAAAQNDLAPDATVNPGNRNKSKKGIIVGGVIAAILLLCLVAVSIVFFLRRWRLRKHDHWHTPQSPASHLSSLSSKRDEFRTSLSAYTYLSPLSFSTSPSDSMLGAFVLSQKRAQDLPPTPEHQEQRPLMEQKYDEGLQITLE